MAMRNKTQLTRDEQLTVYKRTIEQELNEQDAPLLEEWTSPQDHTISTKEITQDLQARGAKQEHIENALQEITPGPTITEQISDAWSQLKNSNLYAASKHAMGKQLGYYALASPATRHEPNELPSRWQRAIDITTKIGWTIQTLGWAAISTIEPEAWKLPVLTNCVCAISQKYNSLISPDKQTTSTEQSDTKQQRTTTTQRLVAAVQTHHHREPYKSLAQRITTYKKSWRSRLIHEYTTTAEDKLAAYRRERKTYQSINQTRDQYTRYNL